MLKFMPKRPKYPQHELADRLRLAMSESKVTLAELARACGVTIQGVHDWRETGRIGKQHLVTISKVTGKPLEYFLVGLGRAALVILFAIAPLVTHQADASTLHKTCSEAFSRQVPDLICIACAWLRALLARVRICLAPFAPA